MSEKNSRSYKFEELIRRHEDRTRWYGFHGEGPFRYDYVKAECKDMIKDVFGEDVAFLYERVSNKTGIVLVPIWS